LSVSSTSTNASSPAPDSSGACRARLISSRDATASSCRTWPKVNERRNVPSVDGARTPVTSRFIPPCRNRSMSSIESAPATIPAISAGIFSWAFPPPGRTNVQMPIDELL
jgi:hypothetical protein